ncbi:AraC family transcriptional regulator [Enterococcus lemanii]|jgi:AraC-like DNA-binding protein/mannose-6-phosphate isomerase-like protein (cupin superfamily)|uniref:Helix-turn-helix domain-containing protein n=1 Tax=Enterococcus lemanii TaxID=1159752 RepID=A0ABV9MUP9_9ENTE|nr:AraC family transcriptional regulator [Enterococcus lemanii]MBM7708859.1 AraC-like DNA-binding protein/mannose-6-phosphate isomerase-like protein (cupin superfamily) [Enterococcus lemanii]NLM66516.1 AraC family transcriptional regulator [Enterococcus sp.]
MSTTEFELVEHHKLQGIKAFLIDMNYRRPHLHSDLEIIYVLRGTLALTMDSKTYYVRKNEFIVINAFQLHELATPQQVKLLILQINPKEYETFFPQINEILFQNQVLTNANLTNFGSFKQLFLQTCLVYFQENSFFQLECHGYAALTLFALLEQAPYDVISEKEQNALLLRKERLRRMIDYIQQHFHEKLLLADLAKQENLSINYLSHFFQNHLGMSFQNYLNHIRCEKAHFLIKNTEMSLLNISETCGFSDLRYLNRAFQQIYHFSPKAYRKQLQMDLKQPEKKLGKKIQEQEFIHQKANSLAVTTQLLSGDFFDK